ncbi:MAG: MerR family transcriptional regulator [Gammaproteobacteria bacterium]|nr:MAG: MerR family transcriptional regulator [Gammaproteobacteria bacterium]
MQQNDTIGQMARVWNCKVQTIRYYEQIGLLPEPDRTAGNQRIYLPEHRNRLNFIRHSRELGFSLDQIRKILALNDEPAHSCDEVDRIASTHLQDVESKIKRLQEMRKELKRMVSQCAGGRVATCRIIEVLSDHSLCLSEDHQKS